jgi:hypothetical protein
LLAVACPGVILVGLLAIASGRGHQPGSEQHLQFVLVGDPRGVLATQAVAGGHGVQLAIVRDQAARIQVQATFRYWWSFSGYGTKRAVNLGGDVWLLQPDTETHQRK